MNSERIQVEVVVAYIIYFRVFIGGTEENHKKSQSEVVCVCAEIRTQGLQNTKHVR